MDGIIRLAIELSVFWPSANIPGEEGVQSIDDRLDALGGIPGLDGVEVHWPVDFEDPVALKEKLDARALGVSAVAVDLFSAPEWRHGALVSSDEGIRQRAISLSKEALDAAATLGAETVTLWPACEGYDYPFQVDYGVLWDRLTSAVREISMHRSDVRVGVEYKLEQPMYRSLVSTVGKALLLCQDVGLDNLGVVIDCGHALIAHENLAESIAFLNRYDRLFHVHLNDNYRMWDHDMIPATVHLWETLEALFSLGQVGYHGWINFDIYSPRDDPVRACERTIKNARTLLAIADNLDRQRIQQLQESRDLAGIIDLLWDNVIRQGT
ncbi:MAG: TIM barrel protein [Chloroflexi bacterium]|nr:TIM barrel protein [Chloroflexota bacterium]